MKKMAVRDGFSLVEAIVALTLLAIALASLLPAFANNMRVNTTNEIRTGAVAVAQQEIDNLRALDVTTWPTSGTTRTVTTGLGSYQSTLWYVQYCDGGGTCYPGARRVTVEVQLHGRPYYRVETVFTSLNATT